jgi:ComF family protein
MFQTRAGLQVGGMLKNGLDAFINLLAPARCLVCVEPVQQAASLCAACWRTLQVVEEPCCDATGLPFEFDHGEGALSLSALAAPPAWDRARTATLYNDTSRELVHSLKYRDRHEAALLMSRLMLRAALPLLNEVQAIVPMPLHRRRLWSRRFNQSGLLAQHLSRASGVSFRPELLVRSKATRQQVGLDFEARRKNVRRAFSVPEDVKSQLNGLNVLLVDDVMTTGATAAAATTAMKAAGAARVYIAVFALVDAPKRLHI